VAISAGSISPLGWKATNNPPPLAGTCSLPVTSMRRKNDRSSTRTAAMALS
jgi:hypothetical protein